MDKILVIGGTSFIGRNLVESLYRQQKFDITLFNRGKTNANLFPGIKRIIGDRNTTAVTIIHESKWDYVIDISCYYPQSLINILSGLSSDLKKYIFISTCSVYQDYKVCLGKEDAKTLNCSKGQAIDKSMNSYGNRKAECERILQATKFNFTILRPDLVYGKYDPTDRFYYWLHQAKMYEKILVPNNGEQRFSLTYVHDLISSIERAIIDKEDRESYNITTVKDISFAQILGYASEILDRKIKQISASSKFLKLNDISEWTDMPIWIDSTYSSFDNSKILEAYEIIPTDFRISVMETIEYYDQLGWLIPKYGIDREEQVRLIESL